MLSKDLWELEQIKETSYWIGAQMTLAELKQKYSAIVKELRDIADKATKETRGFTPEEDSKIAQLQASQKDLKSQVEQIEKRDSLLADMDQETRNLAQPNERKTAPASCDTLEEIGLGKKEVRNYSLLRAIGNIWDGKGLSGLELEVSKAIEKRSGRTAQGFFIPNNLPIRETRADLTTTTGSGALNQVVMYSDFIDALRSTSVCGLAGARMLSNLNGVVTIPAMTTGNTAYWCSENTAPTESSPVIGQVTLTPKTVGAYTDIGRRLILQTGSFDVEAMIRQDIAATLAVAIDAGALAGNGASNAPTGILYNTSVTSVDAAAGSAAGAPDWADIVGLETTVANASALLANAKLGYVTNSKVKGALKTTLKASAAGSTFIWENGDIVNGYKAFATNSIPSNLSYTGSNPAAAGAMSAILFGNWDDLVIGSYGSGIDLLTDPYTGSNAGTLRVRALCDVSIALRRAASFVRMFDVTAA